MEWKTTTSGDTILHLEDWEREHLTLRAAEHGDMAMAEALKRFDSARRQHPHIADADFLRILDIAFPPRVKTGAQTIVNKAAKPSNPYAETLEIERAIRKQFSAFTGVGETSASMQAAATLLMALAMVNQTRVLGAKLDLLAVGLDDVRRAINEISDEPPDA